MKLVVRKDTGKSFAAKVVDKKKFRLNNSTQRPNALMDEVDILSKLRHPNVALSHFILSFVHVYQIIGIEEVIDTDKALYIILELCVEFRKNELFIRARVTGGELFDKIVESGNFSEEQSKIYTRQMLHAVEYLHKEGIVHRDLKVCFNFVFN